MNLKDVTVIQQALFTFVNQFKAYLGRTERLHWCWMYLSGLLLDGERKSIQPMAERLPGGKKEKMKVISIILAMHLAIPCLSG